MNQHRNRRSKFRSNGRGRRNGMNHSRHGMRSLDVGQPRQNNNFGFRGYQNAEKLIEKYSKLAKEALSTGDKILSENYFQHADHFMRIIDNKNRSQSQPKPNLTDKTEIGNKESSQNQNKDITQKSTTDNKE